MKYKVMVNLKACEGKYISGEALSGMLGVSRTAIWKYINELKREGYSIEASSRKGYRLVSIPDIISKGEISYGLDTFIIGREICCFDSIDSTSSYAKKIASEGCADGTVVVADSQTAGRGRLGRQWDSKGGKGIWMSVVLRPQIVPEDIQIITLAASVAVVKALKTCVEVDAGIKWPNDIILDGKKVCGILSEMSLETDRVNYLILGIGLNVNHSVEDFPEELKNTAVSLAAFNREKEGHSVLTMYNRSSIIRQILKELELVYNRINTGESSGIIDEWRKYSITLGKQVRVTVRGTEHIGIAEDITSDGRLVVSCDDGIRREILSGEISVRGLLGYV